MDTKEMMNLQYINLKHSMQKKYEEKVSKREMNT